MTRTLATTRTLLAALLVPMMLAMIAVGCNNSSGDHDDEEGGSAPPAGPPAPSGLTYDVDEVVYTVGELITPVEATVNGIVTEFTVSPPLPAGLFLDATTGRITGLPLATAGETEYTVRASGPGGVTTTDLRITVIPPPLNDLEYDTPVEYALGVQITSNVPGDPSDPDDVISYTVAPELPDGLGINANSGVIFGTPLVLIEPTDFTVTELTLTGSRISVVNLAVITTPPTDLVYDSPITYFQDIDIVPNVPQQAGSPITEYDVVPPLPAGLILNEASGIITGRPTELSDSTDYTVTGTNESGSVDATLTIEVVEPGDCNLTYESPVTYIPDVEATDNVPTFDAACELDTFTISPDLPAGLTMDESTGVISGIPEDRTPRTPYTVKATGIGGDSGVAVVIITTGPVYRYILEDIEVTYPTDTGEADFSLKMSVEEGADNANFPNAMTAFQTGFKFDTGLMIANEVFQGEDLADLNGGNGPEFWFPLVREEGITVGAVISSLSSDSLIADEIREVLDIDFSTVASAFTDNNVGEITDVFFDDTMGPLNDDGEVLVRIRNTVTLDQDGEEFEEETVRVDGSVEFTPEIP